MTTILWRGDTFDSTEYCRLSATDTGHRLSGAVLVPVNGEPDHIRYRVDVDYGWRTRRVTVVAEHGRSMVMSTGDDGGWIIDGRAAPEFDGCLDIDLGFSPSTNTLPIRRLTRAQPDARDLTADVRAVWLRFPEFTLEVLEQSYRMNGDRRWSYRAGEFTADLEVDWSGLVRRYRTESGDLFVATATGDD